MNGKIKGTIAKVKRGTFTNNNSGEVISYCKFNVLVLGPTTENESGYDYESLTCKVDNFSKILEFMKSNKQVEISVEFVKQKDGNFRRVAKKIDDYEL